jgi:hypothetical protein
MGTYAIVKMKNPDLAGELNALLKAKYKLDYLVYNKIDFGLFLSKEMFNANLEFLNNDVTGKKQLESYPRPISPSTYESILFGAGNCFGNFGCFTVKLRNLSEIDMINIKAISKFSRTKDFKKYISIVKSENFEELLMIKSN